MAGIGLHQNLSLGQTLSPQMQQSLQFLQAPALELQSLVQQEIEINPVLEETPEEVKPEPETESEAESEDAKEKKKLHHNPGLTCSGVSPGEPLPAASACLTSATIRRDSGTFSP